MSSRTSDPQPVTPDGQQSGELVDQGQSAATPGYIPAYGVVDDPPPTLARDARHGETKNV